MSESSDLYACTKCFARHPFKELSRGLMMCKACRIAYPIVKCTYCRTEFQQSQKNSTSTICAKCESNVRQYGKPRVCEYCNIIAAFIGNKCQRCTNSERKYGLPVTCEQCKQKCAFDRKEEDKKVDGKLLCWLCTLSYKRALAKTKRVVEKKPHLKIVTKSKERSHHHMHHHKRPVRVDVTKLDYSKLDESKNMNSSSSSAAKIPRIHNEYNMDSGASDHIVMISQLTEKYASLEKQLQLKEKQLLEKDKYITELKAAHFTKEEEHRTMMTMKRKEYEKEVDALHGKVKSMQREIGTLSKKLSAKNAQNGNSNSNTTVNIERGGNASNNGGGTGSQDESGANSPASST